MSPSPTHLYKITTPQLWQQSRAALALAPSDAAFIHLAEEHDVDRIIARFFAGHQKVVVLTLDVTKLIGRLVKEANPGGSLKYFHLYEGAVPREAIVAVDIRALSA